MFQREDFRTILFNPHQEIHVWAIITAMIRLKDRILWRLIKYYQQGGDNERLASVFLLIFKPAILDLHDRGGKRCPQLDDNDLFQEICLILLQIIKESRITATKVAGKIIEGRAGRILPFLHADNRGHEPERDVMRKPKGNASCPRKSGS